jgi:4'-phosphopantetheinyl transferase
MLTGPSVSDMVWAEMNQKIPLAPEKIDLWLAFYDEIAEEGLHAAYRKLLNPEEKVQEQAFYFARDRRRYLITRALVRTVLSRYLFTAPSEWSFSTNAYGRPEIVNAEAANACLSFNISHTHSVIILGVTQGRALGVDVENFRAREVSLDIADHYFAPQEVAVLAARPPQEQQYRFFEYWTLKESYIKARGMGLSLPLDKFSFHYPHDQAVEIAIHPDLDDDGARWQFWQFQPRPGYLAAICAERIGAHSPDLIVRQAIPLLSEHTIAVELLRTSA